MKKKTPVARVAFTTRLRPDLIAQLKHRAIDEKKLVNHLIEQSIENLLKSYKAK